MGERPTRGGTCRSARPAGAGGLGAFPAWTSFPGNPSVSHIRPPLSMEGFLGITFKTSVRGPGGGFPMSPDLDREQR